MMESARDRATGFTLGKRPSDVGATSAIQELKGIATAFALGCEAILTVLDLNHVHANMITSKSSGTQSLT
jgi:hypothetical protein